MKMHGDDKANLDVIKKPYVIAEAGSNFNQNLDEAKRLIDVAVKSRANAVKFQLFKADCLYPKKDGLYNVFKSLELNYEWLPKLKKHADGQGIDFIASAFDFESLDELDRLGVWAHKIASSEVTNLKFLHYVASKKKPIFISTGMCDLVNVQEAINIARNVGNNDICIMQCGSMYPLPIKFANLLVIKAFKEQFNCHVGFSDHTLGFTASIVAVGLGATVFEKHFTLDRNAPGPDHFYALEPNELGEYVEQIQNAHECLGDQIKDMLPDERLKGRRDGVYFSRDLIAGHVISTEDIVTRRPAGRISARYSTVLLGGILKEAVKAGDSPDWETLTFNRAESR